MKKYDAILCVNNMLNEDAVGDERMYATKLPDGTPKFFQGHGDWDNPKYYSQFSFGNTLQSMLSGLGKGFSAKVTEFGKWVVVDITYHNSMTGRSASKTFLIVFQMKGDGIVLSTHNKYRSISGVSQAASYIRSAVSPLQNSTQSKI